MERRGWKNTSHNSSGGLSRHRITSAIYYYVDCPAGGEAEYHADTDYLDDNWVPRAWDFKFGSLCGRPRAAHLPGRRRPVGHEARPGRGFARGAAARAGPGVTNPDWCGNQPRRNGNVNRNSTVRNFNSPNALRASPGSASRVSGMVPKIFPLITSVGAVTIQAVHRHHLFTVCAVDFHVPVFVPPATLSKFNFRSSNI